MASSRCALKHTGGPIDSLYRIFGIPNAARPIPSRPVSRPFSSQLFQRRITAQRRYNPIRPLRGLQKLSPRIPPSFTIQTSRSFSSTPPTYAYKTIEQARSRGQLGPLTLKAGLVFVLTGAGIIIYFREERARLERKRIAEQTKGIGRPKVGGPFNLVDHNGNTFTEKDLRGKYSLVYFGFTHCPDICPDELDKMADMIDRVKADCGDVLLPIMISCDPARDKPAVLKPYLEEFHSDIIGLTGEYEDIKNTCKEYRVYFSTPPQVKPGQDYLVDHSIYFYLMDPEGDFVEAIGRNFTAEQAAKVIRDHITDWTGPLIKGPREQTN